MLNIEIYIIFIKQKLDWLINNVLFYILSSPIYAKIVNSRPKMRIYFSSLKTLANYYEKTLKKPILNIEQIISFIALL